MPANELDIFTVQKHFLNIKFKISLIKNLSPRKKLPECPDLGRRKTNYNFPTSGKRVLEGREREKCEAHSPTTYPCPSRWYHGRNGPKIVRLRHSRSWEAFNFEITRGHGNFGGFTNSAGASASGANVLAYITVTRRHHPLCCRCT